jgi:hypothetical protein
MAFVHPSDDRLVQTLGEREGGERSGEVSVRKVLASVREAKEGKEKLVALYTWLNDMRLGIAPDENTPDDERGERQAQVDVIDQIMEWMEEQGI